MAKAPNGSMSSPYSDFTSFGTVGTMNIKELTTPEADKVAEAIVKGGGKFIGYAEGHLLMEIHGVNVRVSKA